MPGCIVDHFVRLGVEIEICVCVLTTIPDCCYDNNKSAFKLYEPENLDEENCWPRGRFCGPPPTFRLFVNVTERGFFRLKSWNASTIPDT